MTNRMKISEVIVVEGRDDTTAVQRAVDAMTIETHGFGIRKETWDLIEKAYNEKGIIILTDPDFSGEEIRKKLTARFPDAKQAFLTRGEATKKGDIGIENAEPEDICAALEKAHATACSSEREFTEEDLFRNGLMGGEGARERREQLGRILGIGYANSKKLLIRLNSFEISREEFNEALLTINH